jgi:phenylalanyl-tRNA synthetase alpha subunit
LGIRDFIEYLGEHRERVGKAGTLSEDERAQTLREAEMMVGMTEAAVKELDSVIANRRVNLPEEHALRFAQDVFEYLKEQEEKVKERMRENPSP